MTCRVWSRNLETEEAKARYRAVKIQPQWVVTPGKPTTTNIPPFLLAIQTIIPTFFISNFRRVLDVVCFLLGNSPASVFCMRTFRNTLFRLHREVGVCSLHTLHDHTYYHACPDILSLVGDPLSGNEHVVLFFLLLLFTDFTQYKVKPCCIKSKANHVLLK
jgi:hypothetical protein